LSSSFLSLFLKAVSPSNVDCIILPGVGHSSRFGLSKGMSWSSALVLGTLLWALGLGAQAQPAPVPTPIQTGADVAPSKAVEQPDTTEPSQPDDLVFDFSKAHNFAGLGAHIWVNPTQQDARDAAYRDLHMRFLRASVYPKVPENLFKDHMTVEELLDLTKANDSPEFQAHVLAAQKEISSLGAELHLVSWEMPEPWRNDSTDHKHRRANSDHIADYANLLVARILYAKELGITPSYIEPTNEPDGDWNTQYTPEQYDALVVAARTAMDQHNLQNVKIEGPGIGLGGGTDHIANYLNAVRANGHGDMLGLVSAHDYDVSRVGSKWPRLNFILPAIQAFGRPLNLYYTEFGNSSHYWGLPPYTGGVKRRSENNGVDTPDFGVTSGGDALKLMAEGANGLFIWELADETWGNGSRGVVSIKGERKPLYYGLQVIFAGLPWDVAVVGGSKDNSQLVTLACQTPDGLRFYAANLSATKRSFTASFTHAKTTPTKIGDVKIYDAKGSSDASTNQPVLENGVLKDEIAPRTLLSISLQ